MLRKLKSAIFQFIRNRYLYGHVQDIQNYLWNVEVQQGCQVLQKKKIIVLAPHPDDESIGCGGTLKLLSEQQCSIHVIFLTQGEAAMGELKSKTRQEELKDTRRNEAKQAAQILGLSKITFLEGQDGKLHKDTHLVATLTELLKKEEYDAVFCPWAYDGQSDHAAAFRIFKSVLKSSSTNPLIWFYEVWTPLLANRVVSIDSTIESKIAAIKCYKSQTALVNYPEKVRGLAQHRSMLCQESHFAEAFFSTDRVFVLQHENSEPLSKAA